MPRAIGSRVQDADATGANFRTRRATSTHAGVRCRNLALARLWQHGAPGVFMFVRKAYIDRLNQAREAKGFSIDSLSLRCGYPADLVAPLFEGRPVMVSEDMNRVVCEALELDALEMWELAQPAITRRATRTAE